MRKAAVLWLLMALATVGLGPAYAQEENKSAEPAKTDQPKTIFHAYRVDFAINELEDGKKINSRHYSMNLNSGDGQELKIGTRVPVATGQDQGSSTQFQYMDVGTRIYCRLDERGDDVGLSVRGEFSNFSAADAQHGSQPLLHQPIVRNISIGGSTLAVSGKTVVIGGVDDPNSNREFQLDATVTRLK